MQPGVAFGERIRELDPGEPLHHERVQDRIESIIDCESGQCIFPAGRNRDLMRN